MLLTIYEKLTYFFLDMIKTKTICVEEETLCP